MDRAVPSPPRRIWVALDLLIVIAAYLGMFLLRFQGHVPSEYWSRFTRSIPLIAATFVGVNLLAGAYSTVGGIRRAVLGALASGVLVFFASVWADQSLPLSVTIAGALVSLLGFVGVRVALPASRRPSA